MWAAPAVALFLQTIIFWFRYKKLNHDEFMTEIEDPKMRAVLDKAIIEDADHSNLHGTGDAQTEKELEN